MKLIRNKSSLQESSYSDLVNNISSAALNHPYMSDKRKTSAPAGDPKSVDVIDITTADKYVNASNIPCIIILGTREDEHATFKLNKLEDIDIDGFYDKAKEIVKDSLTYSNPDTYEALLYGKSTSNKPYLVRRLSVINKSEKKYELANMYRFNVSTKSISEENKYIDGETYIISEKISNPTYYGPLVVQKFQDAIKAIKVEPFVETPEMKKPIDDTLSEKDMIHSLKTETKNDITYPIWVNYNVTEINTDAGTVELTPVVEEHDYNPDDIDSSSVDVSPDELKRNYYLGDISVDLDYRNTCIIHYDISRITGEKKFTNKGEYHTTIENFTSFMENNMSPVAINEDLEKPYRNVITRAYSDARVPYNSVVNNFNDITGIKRTISQLLADNKAFYVDTYDENDVCHYQAEKMVDDISDTSFWNVMTDDFYETSRDSKKSTSITEALLGTKFQYIIHLPYFDKNEADSMDASSEYKDTITAISKAQCKKYAENLIRSKSKDKTWADAYIDSIEPLDT